MCSFFHFLGEILEDSFNQAYKVLLTLPETDETCCDHFNSCRRNNPSSFTGYLLILAAPTEWGN